MYYQESFSPKEVIEYLRKSRSDDPLLSVEEVLERHETILNEYAEKYFGGRVPEDNIFREIASSETIDGRPEMLRLLKAVESPKFKAVFVVEVQRLSRGDLEDAGRLIKLLRYTKTKVITPQKTYDLNDEYDRDIFERELKRGNEYLEYFKKIQARGRLASVKDGNFVGSIPPYGYDKVFITEGKRKCPTLAENKEQADVIRMIFDLYVNHNMGHKRICNHLEALGINPPKGSHWSPAAVKDMLSNVHYIGKVKWNWRKTVTVVEDQEIIKTRPKSNDYLIFEGRHDGIISEELFAAAQEKQGRNYRAKPATRIRNPLAGILFCQCGKAMSLRSYTKNGSERCAPRLMCNDQSHCNTASAIYDEVVEQICSILKGCIADFEMQLKNDDGSSAKQHNDLIHSLENRLRILEAKELSQWEKYSEEGMPKSVFDKLNEKVLHEKEETKQALSSAYESLPAPIDYKARIVRFSDALSALTDQSVSAEVKNRYLKAVFVRLVYYREKPVRITKKNANAYEIDLKTGGNWYSPPFELDVTLKI